MAYPRLGRGQALHDSASLRSHLSQFIHNRGWTRLCRSLQSFTRSKL